MNYVYPELSNKDFGFIRVGGAGLGNILFTYARAWKFAKENQLPLIWPTWPTIPVGQILRNESNKRFYNQIFVNQGGYIDGFKKQKLLLTKERVTEQEGIQNINNIDNKIIVFRDFEGCFEPIFYDSVPIYEELVKNLHKKNKKAIEFDPGKCICMHIRLGDFVRATEEQLQNGQNNSSIPMKWYVNILNQIREIIGVDIPVYIFSDGTKEELKLLLDQKNIQLLAFGTAIGDILAMTKATLFIASGSSFSMWVRYLGRMSTITYKNQIKQKILNEDDTGFEIEVIDQIDKQSISKLSALFL